MKKTNIVHMAWPNVYATNKSASNYGVVGTPDRPTIRARTRACIGEMPQRLDQRGGAAVTRRASSAS